ncbi:L,D-transpeptidase family protein [Streptomyces sp. HPF1205]|uniref:L,D-transpeptidase family protein n=1 Tax=Streptomyces sp. HPF1205 TaxID=2873262 RepID=UPI001CED3496|nr:L,D-transpeptidase family protein [Streptomyces sp. HPF1205]
MRTRSPAALAVAAVTAALSAAVLTACGPQDTGADGKAPSRPAATTGSPTTPAARPTTAPPTTQDARPTTAPPTTPPAPTTTAPATTAPPARPAAFIPMGSSGDRVRELQARLGQLGLFGRTPTGYYGTVTRNAVTDFQERHGLARTGSVSRTTWTRLTALTRTPTHQELYPAPAPHPAGRLDPRCMTGHAMCISKTTRTLSWVVDGKVLATMDVRFGSQYTPTREGLFHVTFKSRNHVSTIYHTAMPYAMFFSGGEAVHYSSDFAARGYAGASHGCVNVRDKAAIAKLFDEVRVGDKVVVYW